MAKTIYVTRGEIEYVGGTITADDDISAAPIVMALGDYDTPPAANTGQAPDVDTPGLPVNTRTVKLLIDGTTVPPGRRVWVWAWITDNPEVVPLRLDGPLEIT